MFKTLDLENFLKEHRGEWWSPNEIGLKLVVDLRTVKNVIRRLHEQGTLEGWVLELAERGERLYVVRMVRDIKDSENLIKAEIFEVENNSIHLITLNNFQHANESQKNNK